MIQHYLKGLIYLALIQLLGCNTSQESAQSDFDIYHGIEFEMPVVSEPEFPDYSVSILDFGANNDGQTLNTEAFEKAIAEVSGKGGGRVVIPRGIWLTGPIVLKSNINLHAAEGALVVFSRDKDLYPLIEGNFEGTKAYRCLSPISGNGLENIAFTGEGVYDGSGDAWRMVKRFKTTDKQWKELLGSGGVLNEKGNTWYPSEEALKGVEGPGVDSEKVEDYLEIKDALRPVMVSLVNCNKVLFDGPVFQNSPAWCIHPLMCKNLTVRNIDVRNPWFSQNGDGLDLESCTNSIVYNCTFDVGDDAICIKSGKDMYGRDRGIPTLNTVVKNCVVYHGHGGVTVGSEMSGGVKNLHVSGCTFIGTDVGLRFKSKRGRGGIVEKVFISNIDMLNIPTKAISFNLYYGGLSISEMLAREKEEDKVMQDFEVSEETPQFKDIQIRNIRCKGAYQAIYLQGLPEMNLENIHMEDIIMEAENGLFCMDAKGVSIRGLSLVNTKTPALTFYNSKDVVIEDLDLPETDSKLISVFGKESASITIDPGSDLRKRNILQLGDEVLEGNVILNY